jgi:RNA polymerase sigma factor (sigma-70 family)
MPRTSADRPDDYRTEFAELYRHSYWKLHAFVRRRLAEDEAARDIVAEAYRIAWQKRDTAVPAGLPYLYAICRNLLGNEYQRRTREDALLDQLAKASLRAGHESPASLVHALKELPSEQREVLYLTYWEDLPAQDVARVLNCTDQAVWKRLSRARSELKRLLTVETGRSPKE